MVEAAAAAAAFNDELRNDETPSPMEQAPAAESPRAEIWNQDVKETGRWGTRNRMEIVLVISIALLIIGATVTGVAIAVTNSNNSKSDEPVGKTKVDPITGVTVSAYELPIPLPPTIITDQEELDLILKELSSNTIVSSPAVTSIPKTVADLTAAAVVGSTDPYLLAASWLTTTDTVNAQEFAVARFALAVTYYTDQGSTWYNSTNWLSTAYHCDWYGVKCCEQMIGSTMCELDSFGRIVELDLFKNNLVGSISASLVLLPQLQSLYVSDNSLTGTLPGMVFGGLKNFSKLYAAYNYLSGTIPVELNQTGMLSK
jgi:hypothetical protein